MGDEKSDKTETTPKGSLSPSDLLIKYEFTKKNDKGKYVADEEKFELVKENQVATGYPNPVKHLRMIWESPTMSIEEVYHWILTSLRFDHGFSDVAKIYDVFAASQSSSFFGHAQARLGINQDRASNLFAQIGKMVKDLFQFVRELRNIEERLEYYNKGESGPRIGENAAEIALKGVWVDQVEGGAKNATSVLGLSREVGFTILPDLFFSIHPMKDSDVKSLIDKFVKENGIANRKVVEVLSRKLFAYITWRQKTKSEFETRFNFEKKYLKQHYEIIRMYMEWVRPYVKFSQMLSMKPETLASPDLVSAFEGSLLEIELLLKKPFDKTKTDINAMYGVVIVNFMYRTTPTMPFQQEQYQHRGPLHVGKVEVNFRAYAWNKDQVANYIQLKQEEDFELLKSINESIRAAMDALGDDLKKYLLERGEYKQEQEAKEKKEAEEKKEREEKTKMMNVFEPFTLPFKGAWELIEAFFPKAGTSKAKPVKDNYMIEVNKSAAKKAAIKSIWLTYNNFKKGHGMISW